MFNPTVGRSSVFALAFGSALLAGCGGPGVIGDTFSATNLSQIPIGTIVGLSGTYGNGTCIDPTSAKGAKRADGSTWADPPTSAKDSLSVVTNDVGCGLNITSALVSSGGATQKYTASAPLPLSGAYQAMATSFSYTDPTGKTSQLYANADLTPADFSANFIINLVYSDNPGSVSAISIPGSYATVFPNAIMATGVAVPADNLDFSKVSFMKDANNLVISVSADPTFIVGSPAGSGYVISMGACPSTQTGADATYRNGAPIPITTHPTAADLGLVVGTNLSSPVEHCMIVANCSAQTATICSYQLFDITFK